MQAQIGPFSEERSNLDRKANSLMIRTTNIVRRIGFLLLSLIITSSVLAGCQRVSRQNQTDQAPDVTVTLNVEPSPPVVGKARLVVQLADAAGKPIESATIDLRGDMSHAGMQPVMVTSTAGAAGSYPTDFEWTMAGDWIVTVTAALPDGRTATRQFDLTVQKS